MTHGNITVVVVLLSCRSVVRFSQSRIGIKAYWDTKDCVVPWHRQTTVLLWTAGPEGKQGGLSASVPFLGDIIRDTSMYYNYSVAYTDLLRIHLDSSF